MTANEARPSRHEDTNHDRHVSSRGGEDPLPSQACPIGGKHRIGRDKPHPGGPLARYGTASGMSGRECRCGCRSASDSRVRTGTLYNSPRAGGLSFLEPLEEVNPDGSENQSELLMCLSSRWFRFGRIVLLGKLWGLTRAG